MKPAFCSWMLCFHTTLELCQAWSQGYLGIKHTDWRYRMGRWEAGSSWDNDNASASPVAVVPPDFSLSRHSHQQRSWTLSNGKAISEWCLSHFASLFFIYFCGLFWLCLCFAIDVLFYFLLLLKDRISLSSPDWPWTDGPPASDPRMLKLEVCATPAHWILFLTADSILMVRSD